MAIQFGQGFGESFAGTDDVGETLRKMGETFREFGPAARDLGSAVGNIAQGFQQLHPILLPVVELVAALLKAITSISGVGALVALSAILSRLGISFGAQKAAITSFINGLRALASAAGRARVVSVVATAARGLAAAIGAVVAAIGGVAAAIVVIVALVAAFAVALVIFPKFRAKVIEVVKAIGTGLKDALQGVLDFFAQLPSKVLGFVTGVLTTIVNAFKALPGLIISAIVTLPGLLIEFFLTALGHVLATIITVIGNIIVFFIELPGKIIDAISSLATSIVEFFTGVFDTVSQAVQTGVTNAVEFFAALPGRLLAAAQALPGLLSDLATEAFNRFKDAIVNGAEGALEFARGLPEKIKSAIGSAGNILYKAGVNVIKGLINGMKSMLGEVGDAIADVTNKIKNALPGSPVKEGPLSGSHQPNMLGEKLSAMIADGIRAGVPAIRKATNQAALAAAFPVSGGAGAAGGARLVRNNTRNTNVSVNLVTGASDGNALAAILSRRLVLGGA